MFESHFIRRWEKQGVRQSEVRRRLVLLEKLDTALFIALILVALVVAGLYVFRSASDKEYSDPVPLVEDLPWEFVQLNTDLPYDMNLDRDHELTEAEVAAYFKANPPSKDMTPAEGEAFLQRLLTATHQAHALRERDANSDGAVTLAENYEYLARFDKNGDKTLDEQEHHRAEQSLRLTVPKRFNEMRPDSLKPKEKQSKRPASTHPDAGNRP